MDTRMDRRRLLMRLGSSGALALVGPLALRARPAFAAEDAAFCTLTPQVTEGPYYFDAGLLRRDVTEGKPGVALRIFIRLVSVTTCLPIPNALVEIWHADASGVYSGYPRQGDTGNVDTTGQKYIRGGQLTDADGVAEFLTIYPGWYRGRVTHIHFKVHPSGQSVATSQLFFPAAISSAVYTTRAPYTTRGLADTDLARDNVYSTAQNADRLIASVVADGTGYAASLTVGVNDPEVVSFVPVVLSGAGANASFFTSELVITNRSSAAAQLGFTYTASFGGGSGTVRGASVLQAGRQLVVADAIEMLRAAGLPIPAGGDRGGTLAVRFGGLTNASDVAVTARTTTPVAEGRAGLAYPGLPAQKVLNETVYLCGLRQNAADRSNVALQNLGVSGDGSITLRVTATSGDPASPKTVVLPDQTLAPGAFFQYSGVLDTAGISNGFVKVERISGTAGFYAYAVINDQANSDGAFVLPVTAASLAGKSGLTVPVAVETAAFTSELTLTNVSASPRTLDLRFVADAVDTTDHQATLRVTLLAGEQKTISDFVATLREQSATGLGAKGPAFAGPVFVTADAGDVSGIVVTARTSAAGGGGRYGLAYAAVPYGAAPTTSAWLHGLRQDGENRSNLALVNTGETDASAGAFSLDLYDGATGTKVRTVDGITVAARRWLQIDGVLAAYAPGVTQGYAQVRRTAGNNPFIVYGVVNDGGQPGQRSGDGAFLAG